MDGAVVAGTSVGDDGEAREGEDGHVLATLDDTVFTVLAGMWRPIVSA